MLTTISKLSTRKRYCAYITITILTCSLLIMLFPQQAHAGIIEDAVNGIMYVFSKGFCENALSSSVSLANSVVLDNALTSSFDSLLTLGSGNAASSAYKVMKGLQSVVAGLGSSILALALLMQMVKISQRVDAQQTIPMLKEIVILVVFFIVFNWLVGHSFDICSAIYDEVRKLIVQLVGDGASAGEAAQIVFPENIDIDITGWFILIIVSMFMYVITFAAVVLASALIMARAIQLYIMAACSPIPIALLAFDETRQMGIGFFKNFCSVCLAGLIIAALVILYPHIMADIIAATTFGDTISVLSLQVAEIPLIACSLMYLFALIKSGAWARDLLGG